MADISEYIEIIELAARGEEVRDSIIAALEAMNAPATTENTGLVKPDGETITVDEDGTLTGVEQYVHPSYAARTGKPTTNQAPGFGDTFTVSQIISDESGHVTAANDRTVTIPSATATKSMNGLMSSTDKTKLDGIKVGLTPEEVDWVFGIGVMVDGYLTPDDATIWNGYLVLDNGTINNGYLEF